MTAAKNLRASTVMVTDDTLWVVLSGGIGISVPLALYPRLVHATQNERDNWELVGEGQGIRWPALDEDLSLDGLIAAEAKKMASGAVIIPKALVALIERFGVTPSDFVTLLKGQAKVEPRRRQSPARSGKTREEGVVVNKAWHVAIGAWIGSEINDPKYRHGLYLVAGAFLAYQALQVWRKGDRGYEEIRELGIGMALPLVASRLAPWVGRWLGGDSWDDAVGPPEPDAGEDVTPKTD